MISQDVMHAVFAAGLGLAAASLFLLAVSALRPAGAALTGRRLFYRRQKTPPVLVGDRFSLAAGLLFAVLLAGISRSLKEGIVLFALGTCAGILAARGVRRLYRGAVKEKRLREIVILFEGVEIYLRAGYSLVQALRAASLLVPGLKRTVNRCVNCWPSGPRVALEQFRKEMNLPEADILVSLLLQIEAAGIQNLKGVMEREAENLDRLRRLKVEARIANRPFYMMLYRILPLAVTLVLIVGPLLYRTYVVMVDAGISPF